jgi:hypothetical protein
MLILIKVGTYIQYSQGCASAADQPTNNSTPTTDPISINNTNHINPQDEYAHTSPKDPLYNRTLTSTHGNVHSRRPSKLLNHSSPMPVHSSGCSRRCASSTAAPARALVVVFSVSRTYPPREVSLAAAVWRNVESASDGAGKRGANQSPRRSKKQRSDQWQEEMKRMRSRAEQ